MQEIQIKNKSQIGQNEDYFEKQKTFSLHCGMHSINHILKRPVYSVNDMDQICYGLSSEFVNPHKHILGGDYDANVIIIGLQKQGCECQWVDKRKQFCIDKYINQKNNNNQPTLMGFLVNIPQPRKIYHRIFRFSARHWLVLRPYRDSNQFAICDSNQETITLKSKQQTQNYIKNALKNQGQIIYVHKQLNNG